MKFLIKMVDMAFNLIIFWIKFILVAIELIGLLALVVLNFIIKILAGILAIEWVFSAIFTVVDLIKRISDPSITLDPTYTDIVTIGTFVLPVCVLFICLEVPARWSSLMGKINDKFMFNPIQNHMMKKYMAQYQTMGDPALVQQANPMYYGQYTDSYPQMNEQSFNYPTNTTYYG